MSNIFMLIANLLQDVSSGLINFSAYFVNGSEQDARTTTLV